MATCPGCEATFDPEELVRHDRDRFLVVHCPDCNHVIGRYRRHGDAPATDRLAE